MNVEKLGTVLRVSAIALLILMIWWTFIGDRPDWLVIEDLHFFGGIGGLALWYGGLALRRCRFR